MNLNHFAAFFVSIARAHAGHHEGAEALPYIQQAKWAWDPTAVFFLGLAAFYWRGLRSFPGRPPVRRWQIGLFFCGIAVLIAAALPPIDTVADQLFSVHMIQHLLISSVGVPLILFGAPFFVSIRAWPTRARASLLIPIINSKTVRWSLNFCRNPLLAVFLYEAVFWFWHVPTFYNLALLNDSVHILEHACMALAAMNFWRIIIDPHPLKSRIALPLRILILGFVMTLDTALSAALTYSQKTWYAYDRLPKPAWFSFDRLQDQRLGGIIMWVAGGMIGIGAIAAIFSVWMRTEHHREIRSADTYA